MTTRLVVAAVVAGAGTWALRWSFLSVAGHAAELPESILRLLRQIPPAALAALVATGLFRPDGTVDVWNPAVAAGAVTALVAIRRRGDVASPMILGLAVATALSW